MSLQALDQPAAVPSAPIKPSRKRISQRMQQALTNLATKGVNQREAAKLAGMSEYHLSRELKKPQIQAFIAQRARENIQVGVLRASARVLELVDAASEHVSLDASKHVLAIDGIAPPQSGGTNVNIINNVAPGYVIKLASVETPQQPSVLPIIDGTLATDRS